LVNKFRRGVIGTLFIKLELILSEWFRLVVNRTFFSGLAPLCGGGTP
jgi:hypothetical protein